MIQRIKNILGIGGTFQIGLKVMVQDGKERNDSLGCWI